MQDKNLCKNKDSLLRVQLWTRKVNYEHPSTSAKEVFVLILIITPVITVVFLIDERSIFLFF